MKTEDCSTTLNDNSQPESNANLMGRREVLNKAGIYALSAATMMVLLKSQAKAANSALPAMPTVPVKPGETWQRTTRS